MKKIGLLTIGQSPRVDMTPEMEPLLGEGVAFIEAGALDSLSAEEIQAIAPIGGETTYVSRLRNGGSATMSKAKVMPLIQRELLQLEDQVSSTIIVCTGSFPAIQHTKPVLFPDQILLNTVKAVIGEGKLGSVVPLEEQKEQLARKWGSINNCSEAATPYATSDIESAAHSLKAQGATLLVMDCMGYTEEHKARAHQATGLPVILARSLVAKVASELV